MWLKPLTGGCKTGSNAMRPLSSFKGQGVGTSGSSPVPDMLIRTPSLVAGKIQICT